MTATRQVLFVCTGNTCRSPLAEALLRRALATRGLEGWTAASAGTGAWDGVPASEGSYLVGLEHGLDLSAHRARLLTEEVARGADLILTMSQSHVARARALGGGDRVHVLGRFVGRPDAEADVRDPFGGSIEGYRRAFDELEALVSDLAIRLEQWGDASAR